MLQVELVKQLLRIRSLTALGLLAAVPIVAGLIYASSAGGRNGTQTGLYGAAPYSAVNHAAATLQFTAPLLLALVVALLGSALGAADREWATLEREGVQKFADSFHELFDHVETKRDEMAAARS